MKRTLLCYLFLVQFLTPDICLGQDCPSVQWVSRAETQKGIATLFIIANISPGWHIYSQFLPDGGPLPTRLEFDGSGDFQLKGPAEEKGNKLMYHDDVFEMDVTTYSGTMLLIQKVELVRAAPVIQARVVYMVCNETSCIPGKTALSIMIPPDK